ncbi:hypothetical protein QF117_02780 [Vibrio sp. YMD68]|uniref:hypothetical protein n=1 Tax=Vibrio sp. YMD68 TaxID=3042300 RepID=UPI00249BCA34|nr:hypothetical protein [Vibrio sp. YMD68]WGV98903.1 hypothetical protein QF117_02780 [Vibrio sp. YMD68]
MNSMRRHWVSTIITATLLISLPLKVKSQHCTEDQWNQALTEQHNLDQWYNQRATRFNRILGQYQQHIFLHREFTLAELILLWRSDATEFRTLMEQQITSSRHYVDIINEEKTLLDNTLPQIKSLRQMWRQMGIHCQEIDLNVNALSSHQYHNTNSTLLNDINALLEKLNTLQALYSTEIRALLTAKELVSAKELAKD